MSPLARRIVEDENFYVSSASLWEILLKKNKPDPVVPRDPVLWWHQYVVKNGIRVLSIDWRHIVRLDTLPGPSKDPFDRILICQSIVENLRLVTKDAAIRDHYDRHLTVAW